LPVIHAPELKSNQLSAAQLSIEEAVKQTIESWTGKLTLEKDNVMVGIGMYDPTSKLIHVTTPPVAITDANTASTTEPIDDWRTIHRKFGHLVPIQIKRSLTSTNGVPMKNQYSILPCEDCILTKARNRNQPKIAKKQLDILEVIETDTQGPFPIIGNDNTNNNVKFVDSKSGWLHFETLLNTQSHTVLDVFIRFQKWIETVTGKKIKNVRCDQGKEYLGEFLNHLQISGIVKQTGIAYDHSFPGKAERAHQTILRMVRAMLRDAKLPQKYYTEAQYCATYIYNRTVHGNKIQTPYERIFGRKPDLSNLKPFGSICYAFIPPEKRTKLDNTTVKCRLLGYGDSTQIQFNGYKLLVEDDESIIFSNSVTFVSEEPYPLPNPEDE
jgi:hypothetical protein